MFDIHSSNSPSQHGTLLLTQLRHAFDRIADGILVADAHDRIVYVNSVVAEVIGCSAESLRGQLLEDIFPEFEETIFDTQYQQTITSQQPVSFTGYIERFTCWVEVRMFPSADGVTICLTNITERIQAKVALQESEARYRNIVDTMHEGIWILDTQGRTTYANRQMAAMLRCDVQALLACNVSAFLYPEDWEAAHAVFAESMTVARMHKFRFRRTDGAPLWVMVSPTLLRDGSNQVLGVIGLFNDVTELNELDQAKDEFLAVLSHELQTPLTSMLGWSEIALATDTPELYRRAMPIVHRNARRQQRLISELLDMSKLLHGRLEVEPMRDRLEILAAGVVATMAPIADQAGVILVLQPGETALPVLADPSRLAHCIEQLIGNGIKYTPGGGTVTVRCRRDGNDAVLDVADSGRGIPAKALQELFLPFRQVDRDEAAGGLGLGLAIVRGIMELHGGTVTAVSDGIDCGSVFTLRIALLDD